MPKHDALLAYEAVTRAALALVPPDADVEKLGLTPEQRDAAARNARLNAIREAAEKGDVLEWGRLLFPEKFPLPFCEELHGYFVEIMTEPYTNTEAPRNHAKTTIKCFLIPLYLSLIHPAMFRHIMNVQATGTKALAINTAIKTELETNEDLREIYGDQVGKRWTDEQFILKNGVIFSAVSAGQSIRGYQRNNIRPDYIVVDDLYNEEDINNPESTEKKNSWFWGTLYPARAKHKQCSIHMQGTAINNEDLLEKLKKQKRWKSKTFRACDEKTKAVLWPQLNSYESLMADKLDMGSIIFNREMQNERRDDATSIVKLSWIKRYNPRDLVFGKKLKLIGVLLGCDPSIGDKEENDPTGIALIYQTTVPDSIGAVDYYIANAWNKHLTFNERIEKLQSIGDTQPEGARITQCRIEAIAGFKDFAKETKRKTSLPVKEIDKVADKISNLENKSHFFENGHVFISQDMPEDVAQELIHQLTTNHPKHDDIRDAVLLCLDNKPGGWRRFV